MSTIDLNGLWRFIVDQDPEYHRDYDYSRPSSLRHWETVPVPGCWNRYAERYDLFEGVAWFVREFDVPELPDHPVARLTFGGVNYLADVFLNGRRVGRHEGGYTAFTLDVSACVQKGYNRLAVRVDNRHLKIRLPAVLGWYNYGGVHRDVSLKVTSGVQMTGLRVVAGPDRQGAAGDIRVSTTPADRPVTVRARILDSDGLCVWEGTSKGQNALELPFRLDSARLWSPEAPALYQCQVEVRDGDRVLDSATCRFGVRHVGERAQRIWLNAIPIYLRGMCYLYDHPATGLTVDMDVVRRDLDDLEAMGVNCLRSHFPLPSQFLSECDRRGMLLWLEVPIYCIEPPKEARGTPFADPGFQALALQMLGEMVEQAANHPSVILWGVGNECRTDHPEAAPFFRACVDRVRALDSTRPISYASLYGNVGCAAEMIDVIGVNEYWGWYDRINFWGTAEREPAGPLPLELPQLKACLAEKSKVGKPLLLTEFGADSMPGYLSDSHELWSEDYHAELIRRTVEIARQFPAVCGVFPFGYSDYRDPSKPVNHYWHGLNLKGVVDYHRGHKLPWKAVQEAYRSIGAAPDNR